MIHDEYDKIVPYIIEEAIDGAYLEGNKPQDFEMLKYGIVGVAYDNYMEDKKQNMSTKEKNERERKSLNNLIHDKMKKIIAKISSFFYSDSLVTNMTELAKDKNNFTIFYPLIDFVFDNFNKKVFDTNYTQDEKKQILSNTLNVAENLFGVYKDEAEYGEYTKYLLNEEKSGQSNDNKTTKKSKSQHRQLSYVIDSIRSKINDKKQFNIMLQSMVDISSNYILNCKEKTIYPIVLDLLLDTFSLEYQYYIDKEIKQKNIETWKNIKKAQKIRNIFSDKLYSSLSFIEQVKYTGLRSYILHRYITATGQDSKKMQKFFQQILYTTSENSKNSPKIEDGKFENVEPIRFMMNYSKIVLGLSSGREIEYDKNWLIIDF